MTGLDLLKFIGLDRLGNEVEIMNTADYEIAKLDKGKEIEAATFIPPKTASSKHPKIAIVIWRKK